MRDSFEFEFELAESIPQAKKIKSECICPIHKRRVLLNFSYDFDGTEVIITRYCCKNHAEKVAELLNEAKLFDHISIKDENGKYIRVIFVKDNL